ncbi:MAG: DUF86 domain-containing protein [Bacillati bacterium ANGP1]|uniref:DUF86 domain-containing protein n=1 Tax=Candidatus Segetimicrobium genomatis TaxID=2569760 RepID=A0A537JYT4_9BACT|nr:MAG: DUF86 domain-containing protein [Terrabacteria group bacterium ANGP1]
MSRDPRERARLRYIHQSIARIEQYTLGGRHAFLNQPIVQDAVLRRLETMADAINKLSDTLKARHPTVPWRQVYGFRNIAAHAYEEIDLTRVWEIVEDYVPVLKSVVDLELSN